MLESVFRVTGTKVESPPPNKHILIWLLNVRTAQKTTPPGRPGWMASSASSGTTRSPGSPSSSPSTSTVSTRCQNGASISLFWLSPNRKLLSFSCNKILPDPGAEKAVSAVCRWRERSAGAAELAAAGPQGEYGWATGQDT